MRQQRDSDGNADAKPGQRFREGRDTVDNQQNRANPLAGSCVDPVCQRGLSASLPQDLRQKQPAAHDQQNFCQDRGPTHYGRCYTVHRDREGQ